MKAHSLPWISLANRGPAPTRQETLDKLAEHLRKRLADQPALLFVCTHNSRRSIFAQIWASLLAHHFELPFSAYSGGTESTAVYPAVISSFAEFGLRFRDTETEGQKAYTLPLHPQQEGLRLFSKEYQHPANPQSNFVAIMTCNSAAEHCPVVLGAESRWVLSYQDPKAADGSHRESESYRATRDAVGADLYYLFQKISDGH